MCCRPRRSPAMPRPRPRRRRRRPKYLSLRRQLSCPAISSSSSADDVGIGMITDQLEDRDPNVACLLEPADDVGVAALLGGDSTAVPPEPPSSSSPSSSSMSLDGDDEELARRALRGRERWVFCSSSPSSIDTAAGSGCGVDLLRGMPQKTLSLKLDYDEILTAWSDRGPLYIDGETPQAVPELYDTPVFVEMGSAANLWTVPEMAVVKEEEVTVGEGKGWDLSREAKVMRYKEKRRSRLFAKRIRYEVRKINAEKRPRIKGRFVKRRDDDQECLELEDRS